MKQLPFLDCAVLSDRTVLPFGEQHLECTDHIFSGVCCFDDLIYIASLCAALSALVCNASYSAAHASIAAAS